MKTLVTVTCGPDSVRISKVTAHGEEIIEADVQAKMLAMMLWRQLGISEPSVGQPLFPSLKSLEKLIATLSADLQSVALALDKHTIKIANMPTPAVLPARTIHAQ